MSDGFAEQTCEHIRQVAARLDAVCRELRERAALHDQSKFSDVEKSWFGKVIPKLAGLAWNSDQYREEIRALGPALAHHHVSDSHHPEHYENGVGGMDLIDVVDMYCDWAAATLRHPDGDLRRSIEVNIAKYEIAGPLADILRNTWQRYGGFSGQSAAGVALPEDPRAEC